jgi:hypothetical protein
MAAGGDLDLVKRFVTGHVVDPGLRWGVLISRLNPYWINPIWSHKFAERIQ